MSAPSNVRRFDSLNIHIVSPWKNSPQPGGQVNSGVSQDHQARGNGARALHNREHPCYHLNMQETIAVPETPSHNRPKAFASVRFRFTGGPGLARRSRHSATRWNKSGAFWSKFSARPPLRRTEAALALTAPCLLATLTCARRFEPGGRPMNVPVKMAAMALALAFMQGAIPAEPQPRPRRSMPNRTLRPRLAPRGRPGTRHSTSAT